MGLDVTEYCAPDAVAGCNLRGLRNAGLKAEEFPTAAVAAKLRRF